MNNRPEATKFLELRSKTDRQLVQFIHNRLDVGLNHARILADPGTDFNWTSVDSIQASARKSYEEVCALLPWVGGVTWTERRRLESKLEDLRELLDESTIHAGMRVLTACS
jgi:hypothetical protein